MKYPILGLCFAAVLGVWRIHLSRAALEPGILRAQVDRRAAFWDSRNAPSAKRVVDIIISDAETEALAHMLPPPSEQLSLWDSQVLSLADKPSVWRRAKTWFRRSFLRRSMAASQDTEFVLAFSDDRDAVVWTHEGFATASGEEMAREIAGAVSGARAAGAVVNIVTQGVSAVPALKAVKGLRDRGGKGPAVGKFVAVDMNLATLRKLAPGDFDGFFRAENLREWAGVWTSASDPMRAGMEFFGPKYAGARVSCEEVFSALGMKGEISERDVTWLVKSLIMENFPMERIPGYLAPPPSRPPKKAASADGKDSLPARPAGGPAGPQDSLSAINAGWLKKEGEKAERTAKGASSAAPASRGTGWERYDQVCGKCCADAGGTWDAGEKRHCCAGAGYDEDIESCRVTWTDRGGRSHGCSYRLACR